MSSPIIPVFARARYGETDLWPADSAQAAALFKLTGCRTLTPAHVAGLQALGFELRSVPDPKGKPSFVPLSPVSPLEQDRTSHPFRA